MGAYINPRNETKEQWLSREATQISREEAKNYDPGTDDKFAVCLVRNSNYITTYYSS